MRHRAGVGAVVVLAFCQGAAAEEWWVKFLHFDTGQLPSAEPDIQFDNNTGKPESELYWLSGPTSLHQETRWLSGRAMYCYPNAQCAGGGLNPALETRLYVSAIMGDFDGGCGAHAQAFDGSYRYAMWFYDAGGQMGVNVSGVGGGFNHAMNIHEWHEYQLVSPGNSSSVTLCVDGNPVGSTNAPPYAGLNGMSFGDGISDPSNGGSVMYDYVGVLQALNLLPVAEADGPYVVDIGGAVVFDASGSYDPDGGSITQWLWDLDDNGVYEESGQTLHKTFQELHDLVGYGEHVIALKVFDNENQWGTDRASLTILAEPGTMVLLACGVLGIIARRRRG